MWLPPVALWGLFGVEVFLQGGMLALLTVADHGLGLATVFRGRSC